MRLIILITVLLPIFIFADLEEQYKLSNKYSNRVSSEASQKIAEKYNLRISSTGGGGGGYKGIKCFVQYFYKVGSFTQDQARNLIIQLTNDYLQIINSDKDLEPFLYEYPFPSKGIDIAIFFENNRKGRVFHPFLDSISTVNDKINFVTRDKNEPNEFRDKTNILETLDEAKKLNAQYILMNSSKDFNE